MVRVEEVAVHGVEPRTEEVGAAAPVDVVAQEEDEVRARADGVDAPRHRGLFVAAPFGSAALAVSGVAEQDDRHLAGPPRLRAGVRDGAGGSGLRPRRGGDGDGERGGEVRPGAPPLSRAHHILTVKPKEIRRRPAARTDVRRSTTTWLMSTSKRNPFS